MKVRVLLIEDDDVMRELLIIAVSETGLYEAKGVPTAEAALTEASKSHFDIAIIDVGLPTMSGIELIPHLLRISPGIAIVAISGNGTIKIAVEAMKHGAIDFLIKPFDEVDLLNLLSIISMRNVKKDLPRESKRIEQPIGASPVMCELLEQVTTIAPFNSTVLITGETGTGKELIARSVHRQSQRAKKPFVALNCAAVPEQLLEDELFGHVKGAFTGAQNARDGRFEQADGGTLFLDEIGDMSMSLQSKLLRVLQEREFEKLGSSRTIKVDVRIVAATSANLEQRIEDNQFRADLYYRLNVVHLRLPPLRQRRADIRMLGEFLLKRFCESMGMPLKKIDNEAWQALNSYHWPGNVRQLQNAMERAAALTGMADTIYLKNLPEEIQQGATAGIATVMTGNPVTQSYSPLSEQGLNFEEVVSELERELLCGSLKKAGGNKMQAAKLLNMKRTTFIEKLKRLGLDQLDIAEEA